jgi:hypothetical protein
LFTHKASFSKGATGIFWWEVGGFFATLCSTLDGATRCHVRLLQISPLTPSSVFPCHSWPMPRFQMCKFVIWQHKSPEVCMEFAKHESSSERASKLMPSRQGHWWSQQFRHFGWLQPRHKPNAFHCAVSSRCREHFHIAANRIRARTRASLPHRWMRFGSKSSQL